MFNTRAKQLLGIFNSANGTAQMCVQRINFFVYAIGQISFSMSPDPFDRVEFRCVGRELIDMESLTLTQESFNLFTPMDLPAIPNDDHLSFQMLQKILHEFDDLCTFDIIGVEANVKSKSSAYRRDAKATHDRDLVAPVTVPQNGSATQRCPSPTHVGDQQEPTFIKEYKMGPKFSCFFLSLAMYISSNRQWLFRHVASLCVLVSGNSTPSRGVIVSRLHHAYSVSANTWRSVGQYVLKSINRWNSQPPKPPSTTSVSTPPSEQSSNDRVVPTSRGFGLLLLLSFDKLASIALQSSMKLLLFEPPHGSYVPSLTERWLDVYVFPTVRGFHVFSYPKYNTPGKMYPLLVKEQ